MTSSVPWKPLLALATGVLAIHLLLLNVLPAQLRVPGPVATHALTTRTIVIAPPSATVSEQQPGVRPTQPRPAPPRRIDEPDNALPEAQAISPAGEQDAQETAAAPPAPATPAPGTGAAESLQVTNEPNAHPIAFTFPGSVRLRYKVTAHARSLTLEGNAELFWRHDGSNYQAGLDISVPPLPIRAQRSTGAITGAGLTPLRFSDKARSEEAAHFQHESGKISFSNNQPDAALEPGAQDRLSVLLQLAAMVAGEPALFVAGTALTIQTASTRDAEPWTFTVEGEEQLQLPGGTLGALKLTRNPRKEFDQRVELWLAPGMDYVPVRLRLTLPNGDWVDQQWASTDRG